LNFLIPANNYDAIYVSYASLGNLVYDSCPFAEELNSRLYYRNINNFTWWFTDKNLRNVWIILFLTYIFEPLLIEG